MDQDTQALDWVVRTGDPAFDDWEGFHAWLEDPRHAAAYHAMALDVEEMAAVVPPAPVLRSSRRWPAWAGGAVAASLALVAGYAALDSRADPYAVETRAGAIRTVTLADGSAVTLGGATRVMLDRNDARTATLERGQAMFVVRHDARDPFEVHVGDARLVDVGTAFDVKRTQGQTQVAVSDGAVDYNPGSDGIRLIKGQGLVATDADGAVRVLAVDVAGVGSWRNSVLAYEGATLAEVADDLSRALGVDLRADPGVATRPFSGSIATSKLAGDPSRVAPLLGVAVRRRGDHWVMTARP